MAEELKRVRTAFIEKVTLPIIKQLLNDLLDVNALNDGEQENILDVNDGRADKACALIDSVRKKGDKASWFIITSLKKRDPMLFEELGLPAEPPHATPKANWWSTNLKLCKNSFWNSKKNDPEIYPVTKESVRSRVALLITNIQFEDASQNRLGADVDERNMRRLLGFLGYEVVKHTNLTGQQMDTAVLNFSKHPKLKDTDSVFVVIMSHGKLGSILGVNWNETQKPHEEDVFRIDNIYKHLNSKNCRALIDKPKIIIIQACRGEEPHNVVTRTMLSVSEEPQAVSVTLGDDPGPLSSDGAGGSRFLHIEKDFGALLSSTPDTGAVALSDDAGALLSDSASVSRKVYIEKDFGALLSCTPDTKSYGDNVKGSLLIQFFVEVVNTWACEKHLEELIRMIMRRFERLPYVTQKQMPTKERWTMTKVFYLFPGI